MCSKVSHEDNNSAIKKNQIHLGDCGNVMRTLPDRSVDLIITSPSQIFTFKPDPTKQDRRIGSEPDMFGYLEGLYSLLQIASFKLKKTGSVYIHVSDFYHAKEMTFLGIPEMFTGMILNPQNTPRWFAPDRPIWYRNPTQTKPNQMDPYAQFKDWEQIIHLTLQPRGGFYFNTKATDLRSTSVFKYPSSTLERAMVDPKTGRSYLSHQETMSTKLIANLITLACPSGGVVMDPFAGEGTTGLVCRMMGRKYIMIEIDAERHKRMTYRLEGREA